MAAQKPLAAPTKLTPEVVDRLVGLLAGGASSATAAQAVGVSRRTVETWRARAWSQRPQDRLFVELEQRGAGGARGGRGGPGAGRAVGGDGGQVGRDGLYGHADARIARQRIREAYASAPQSPVPLRATG